MVEWGKKKQSQRKSPARRGWTPKKDQLAGELLTQWEYSSQGKGQTLFRPKEQNEEKRRKIPRGPKSNNSPGGGEERRKTSEQEEGKQRPKWVYARRRSGGRQSRTVRGYKKGGKGRKKM